MSWRIGWLVVASIAVSPAAHGQAPAPRVTYGATGGSVSQTGVYSAPSSPGRSSVTISGAASTDTVPVVVTGGAASGDTPRAAKDGLWLDEDFSRYTSTEQYLSNPFGWTVPGPKWFHQSQIQLDPGQGYGGSPQSLRYDWPGGPRCNSDYAIISSYKAPPVGELWIEVVHKFATSFNTNTKNVGGMCTFGEYKFLLFWRPTGDRFDLINGKMARQWWSANPESPKFGSPPDCAGSNHNCVVPALGSDMHWDGQWHVYRAHIKFSSSQGARDGQFQIWVDGRVAKDVRNVDMTNSTNKKWSNRLSEIFLGGNSNSGTSRPTQMWWGRLRIYTSDPGW